MAQQSVRIYDNNGILLWDNANYSDNTETIPLIMGPLKWQTWSESFLSNLPILTSPNPIEQLSTTNDETIYLWYRRNVTLKQASTNTIVKVQTRISNALLFFLNGQYLGEFDNHDHSSGDVEALLALDLSHFKINEQYVFEILSISLELNNGVGADQFEKKGIVGNVWLHGQLLLDNQTNLWEHQKGLFGE
jgi:hypothetical protein